MLAFRYLSPGQPDAVPNSQATKKARDRSNLGLSMAEDMGLELAGKIAQPVEMKGGISLYSDGCNSMCNSVTVFKKKNP